MERSVGGEVKERKKSNRFAITPKDEAEIVKRFFDKKEPQLEITRRVVNPIAVKPSAIVKRVIKAEKARRQVAA